MAIDALHQLERSSLRLAIALTLLASVARAESQAISDQPIGTGESDETAITPTGRAEPAFESPRAMSIVRGSRLLERGVSTTAAALDESLGVYVPRSHSTGGTPIVRGLFGRRVLLLLDGVRLDNAITRFDADRWLDTVDPFQLARIEVLRGPGSVLYGSDAIGGVINLISRAPQYDPFHAWDARASALLRFESAATGLVSHVEADGHIKRFGAQLGGTFRHFGDLAGGRDTGEQRFTAYWQGDTDASLVWQSEGSGVVRLRYSGARQHDAFRRARSHPLDYLRVSERFRDLVALDYHWAPKSRWLSSLQATLSYQRQHELRERFRLGIDQLERETDLVHTVGVNLSARHDLPYNALHYGLDLYHDQVGSSAEDETLGSEQINGRSRGRYVDDSRQTQLGGWLVDRLTLGDRLAVDVGGRVSSWFTGIQADVDNSLAAVDVSQTAIIASAHARYLVGDGLNVVAGLSQGFRAPNIDDYTALGCSGQGFDVPSPDLDAEKSLSGEAGLKLDLFGIARGSLFYALTWLDDPIVSRALPTAPAIHCGLDKSGQPIEVEQTRRDNARHGLVHAIEARVDVTLARRWELFSWLAWTRGTVDLGSGSSQNQPLGRAPPLNGLSGVRYRAARRRWFGEIVLRWALRQDRLSERDTKDHRICPQGATGCQGTPGFVALGLRGGLRLGRWLHLMLALENLSNETYRFHGSGLDAPGINAVLSLQAMLR